jgi:hypothetical protein
MKVYIVARMDCIYGVFSSHELADNYINDILKDKKIFMQFYIDERVIDQPDQ